MKEQIEAQLQEWQNELDQLMARRQQLEQARADNEMSVQRHIGAITGARQLLAMIAPPPPPEQSEQGEQGEGAA